MKKFFFKSSFVLILFIQLTIQALNAESFVLIKQWKVAFDEPLGYVRSTFINESNQIVGLFDRTGAVLIEPQRAHVFSRRGEGPNDTLSARIALLYKGNVALCELHNRVKVFAKGNDSYAFKESKWLGRSPYLVLSSDGIFQDEMFIFAGVYGGKKSARDSKMNVVKHVRVYNDNGDFLQELLPGEMRRESQLYLQRFHVVGAPKTHRAYFMTESELKIRVIDTINLKELNAAKLAIPSFYKKMPENFYIYKNYLDSKSNIDLDYENWQTGYSAISRVVLDGSRLVVQIRTCKPGMKKFALLFYHLPNLKLENTVFTDDFLLGTREGNYYCFAGGNPGRDDNTDNVVINIYRWKSEKQKSKRKEN
jgi:hypothetical protein